MLERNIDGMHVQNKEKKIKQKKSALFFNISNKKQASGLRKKTKSTSTG